MEQWEVLPKWMAVLGVIGGIAGLLTLAIDQTRIPTLVPVECFAVRGLLWDVHFQECRSPRALPCH
jgi:hypothetical protein